MGVRMALLMMILRKMAKNKWLQLNLWFGLTVCVALFSSMPLYSHAKQGIRLSRLHPDQYDRRFGQGGRRDGETHRPGRPLRPIDSGTDGT